MCKYSEKETTIITKYCRYTEYIQYTLNVQTTSDKCAYTLSKKIEKETYIIIHW